MNFETRDAQTRVKHEILRSYAGGWSGIISRGLRSRSSRRYTADFVYIDGYGGAGRFTRDTDGRTSKDSIWGSPIIGIRSIQETLAKAPEGEVELRFTAFVVEEDREYYSSLVDNLHAARLGIPIREKATFERGDIGSVAVLRGDFRRHVHAILGAVGPHAYILGFVDPFGPSMPMSRLRDLIARNKTDVITLFPVEDIHRKAASVLKAHQYRSPGDRGNIGRVRTHFGSDDWVDISREVDLDSSLRREKYANLYAGKLRSIDAAVVVKNIPLRFSSADRVVHHFFLTTRDADGAFRMNEILRKAEISQHYAIWADALQRAQQREAATLQENLFGADVPIAAAPALEVKNANPVEVIESILSKCPRGVAMSYKEFVKHIADEPFVRSEVHAALRRLKKDNRVEYDRLEKDSQILLK